jgi:hypothetical protein
VAHKDPALNYTAKGTAGGEDFTEVEALTTDGTASTNSNGAQMKAHWEGTTLIIETFGAQGSILDSSRLTLSSDGKSMTRDYERKSQDDPQKRHEIYNKHE